MALTRGVASIESGELFQARLVTAAGEGVVSQIGAIFSAMAEAMILAGSTSTLASLFVRQMRAMYRHWTSVARTPGAPY